MENEDDNRESADLQSVNEFNLDIFQSQGENDRFSSYFNVYYAIIGMNDVIVDKAPFDEFVLLDVKFGDLESNVSSGDEELKITADENFVQYGQVCETGIAEGEILKEQSKNFYSFAEKFEDVDEELEEDEGTLGEDSLPPMVASDTLMDLKNLRSIRPTSMLIDRAASNLERRLNVIGRLKETFEERKILALKNHFLHKKCCGNLKRISDSRVELTEGTFPIHGNQKYHAVLEDFMKTKTNWEAKYPSLEQEIGDLIKSYEICRTKFKKIFEDFQSRESEIGSQCIDSKTGRVLTEHKIRSLVKKQNGKFNELANVRVDYLKLRNSLADVQSKIREMNLMGEGRTLMDYEQLVIENHCYMDKLDERDEELRKLREKYTQNVSILSHMRETTDALVYDIMNATTKLESVAAKKKEARWLLAYERKKRDVLRQERLKIRNTVGLLDDLTLLKKLVDDKNSLDVLKRKVEMLEENTTATINTR